jgi:hypothetical protein
LTHTLVASETNKEDAYDKMAARPRPYPEMKVMVRMTTEEVRNTVTSISSETTTCNTPQKAHATLVALRELHDSGREIDTRAEDRTKIENGLLGITALCNILHWDELESFYNIDHALIYKHVDDAYRSRESCDTA